MRQENRDRCCVYPTTVVLLALPVRPRAASRQAALFHTGRLITVGFEAHALADDSLDDVDDTRRQWRADGLGLPAASSSLDAPSSVKGCLTIHTIHSSSGRQRGQSGENLTDDM